MSLEKIVKEKGFTLVELMVVVAIIGMLASTVLASLQNSRALSRDASRFAHIKQLQNALELYRNANNGLYPTNPTGGEVINMNTGTTNLLPYLPNLPRDPFYTGSNSYRYSVSTSTSRTSYTVLMRYEKTGAWCSVSGGTGLGYDLWNGKDSLGVVDGTNYDPCFE